MNSNTGFEIRHLSHRTRCSSDSHGMPVSYIVLNLVFVSLDSMFDSYLKETIDMAEPSRIFLEREDMDRYISGLGESFQVNREIDMELACRQVDGYQFNTGALHGQIYYIEKFNVYRFYSYLQDNPVTRGAIEYLEAMQAGKAYTSRFVPWCVFRTVLETLSYWWD